LFLIIKKNDNLGPNGEFWTSSIKLSGSIYTIWQFILFLALFWSYPYDRKSDRNILV